jgi:hypothetical protein
MLLSHSNSKFVGYGEFGNIYNDLLETEKTFVHMASDMLKCTRASPTEAVKFSAQKIGLQRCF